MKPPKSKMAELAANATGGEKSHAEAKCARAEGVGLPECEARAAKRSQEVARGRGIEFKQTELGPIPVDWEVKNIGQCGEVITGSTPPRGISELWGGSFNWISAKDFRDKYIISSDEKITEAGKRYCRVLPRNSVLVTCIASIGLNAIAKRSCATNQQINAVVCRDCDYEYFYYQCCFNESRLRQMAGQTAVPIIGKSQFEAFHIALPKEIKEQQRIAGALSDVDELISALGKLIEKKRNIKTGAMQELLTGKTRLPGFKGKWVEKRLGECGTWLGGGTPSTDIPHYWQGSVPWISSSDIEEGNIWNVSKTRFVSNDGIVNSAACICPRGTIHIVTRVGIGKVAIATEPVCTSQDYANLVSAQCDNKFLAFLISVVMLSKKEETQGTSIKGITLEDLKKIVLSVPPTLAEQKAIATVLSDMDAEIAALEADRAKYERIKSGMMQELLTGRTRLRDFAAREEAQGATAGIGSDL